MDLPRHPVVHGHPVHAILSDGPAVMIPVAFAVEGWHRTRNDVISRQLSDAATGAATAAATSAALIGWIDWLTIPGEHPVHTSATLHGLINSTGVLALLAAFTGRRRRLALLGAATASLLVGAWIGGELVFRFGWRVRPAEEAEIAQRQLAKAGQHDAFDAARKEVEDFEQRKTFIPARPKA